MVEIDNNPDLKASITQQNTQFGYEYGKCVYTADIMKQMQGITIPAPYQILSESDVSKIKNCVCEKMKIS